MNRKQIIEIVNTICDYLDEKLQDKSGFVEIGVPISVDSIVGYKITSITTTTVKNEIVVGVKFECNGLWPYSVGKYYFLEEVGGSFRLKLKGVRYGAVLKEPIKDTWKDHIMQRFTRIC